MYLLLLLINLKCPCIIKAFISFTDPELLNGRVSDTVCKSMHYITKHIDATGSLHFLHHGFNKLVILGLGRIPMSIFIMNCIFLSILFSII